MFQCFSEENFLFWFGMSHNSHAFEGWPVMAVRYLKWKLYRFIPKNRISYGGTSLGKSWHILGASTDVLKIYYNIGLFPVSDWRSCATSGLSEADVMLWCVTIESWTLPKRPQSKLLRVPSWDPWLIRLFYALFHVTFLTRFRSWSYCDGHSSTHR